MFKNEIVITKTEKKGASILIDKNFQLLGSKKNNLLELHSTQFKLMNSHSTCYRSSPDNPYWDAHLGHPNHQYEAMIVSKSKPVQCRICKECKLKTLPFVSKFKRFHKVVNAVHMDLFGPFPVQSPAGYFYFLTIINQFSGYWMVKFLRNKSDTFGKFLEFKSSAKKQTGCVLRMLVSDGGSEFINKDFKNLCASKGIIHHVSLVYTPQNKGMEECAHQTMIFKARCLLAQ